MRVSRRWRWLLDGALYLLMILLMGQHLAPRAWHEYLGVALFGGVVLHTVWNFSWYRAVGRGRYTVRRGVQTAVNGLLLVSVVLCFLSALMISGVVLRAVRIPHAMWWGRRLHMLSSAWCLVWMSVHAGMHWRQPRPKGVRWAMNVALAGGAAVGVYQFLSRRFWEELFLLTEFKALDYTCTFWQYAGGTLCLSVALAAPAYGMRIWRRQNR